MSEISTQVSNRIKWARYLLTSYQANAPIVFALLEALFEDDDAFDVAASEATMEAYMRRLGRVTDQMEEAEQAVAVELSDDDAKRNLRDRRVDKVRELWIRGKAKIEDAFGEEAVAEYGMSGETPRQADDLRTRGRATVKLLEENPRSTQDVFDSLVDTNRVAAAIRDGLDELDESLEEVDVEKRELHNARSRRDELVGTWSTAFRATAESLSGLYRQVGRPDLADRVRPTVQRTEGKTEPPEDADQPVADDDVEVEPADA